MQAPTAESRTSAAPGPGLSPWWRQGVIIVLILGFSVLIYQAIPSLDCLGVRHEPPRPDLHLHEQLPL